MTSQPPHSSSPRRGAPAPHIAPRRAGFTTPHSQTPRHESPRAPRDVYTLRILSLLYHDTDEQNFLSSSAIKERLAHPREQGDEPLLISCSSIRSSIEALRVAGFDIAGQASRGYALVARPIPSRDIKLIVQALQTCASLTGVQRRRLIGELVALAGPTQQRLLAGAGGLAETDNAATTALSFQTQTPLELARYANEQGIPLSFELAQAAGEPPCSARITMMPESLTNAGSAWYLAGTVTSAARATSDSLRAFCLDRMVNLTLVDHAGTVRMARGSQRAAPVVAQASAPAAPPLADAQR